MTLLPALAVQLSYPLAFAAGAVSFLSPCVFPLLPAYLAYLGGRVGEPAPASAGAVSASPAGAVSASPAGRAPVLAGGVAFVAGFTTVFVTFFYVFTALDVSLLRTHRHAIDVAAGVVVLVLALEVLGVVRIGLFLRERRLAVATGGRGLVPAFLLGVSFAAGWTPCVGPQLTAILAVASAHEFAGLPVMLAYCAGLGLPFIAAAAMTDRLQGVIRALNSRLGVVNLAGGALLLVMGLLLVTDHLTLLSGLGTSSPVDL